MRAAIAVLLLALDAAAQTITTDRLGRAFEAIDSAASASNAAPGMVIAITDRTHTLKIGAYGYADVKSKTRVTPDTLFEIGSVTKSFTAILNGVSGAGAVHVIYGSATMFGNGLVSGARAVFTADSVNIGGQTSAHFGSAVY